MIIPQQFQNPQVKPKWQIPMGVMESVVAYNCRKYSMPVPILAIPLWEMGGNRVIDLGRRRNHGTIIGANWTANGLNFGGSDYVDCGDINLLTPGEPFTIFALSKYTDDIANQTYPNILSMRTTTGVSFGIAWARNDGSSPYDGILLGGYSGWDTIKVDVHADDNKDKLVSCTVIYDGGTTSIVDSYKFYFNGVTKTLYSSGDFANAGNYNRIGRSGSSANYFVGLISCTIIFSCALSAAQAKFLHDNPYFMFQLPEELHGYAAGAPPSTTIPVFIHLYNQMRA